MDSGSSNNSGGRRPTSCSDRDDPFLALRRYADAQIASLLQTFTGLPSGLREYPSSTDLLEAERRRYKQRLDEMRASIAAREAEQPKRNEQQPGSDTVRPDEMFRRGFGPHACDKLFNLALVPKSLTEDVVWPLGYLLISPYSPLHLERDIAPREPMWRDAFEDLMAASNNEEMPNRRRHQSVGSWLRSQILQSMKRDHSVELYDFIDKAMCNILGYDPLSTPEDDEEECEQDDSRLLPPSNQYPTSEDESPLTPSHFPNDERAAINGYRAPLSIISTLTTKERITAPDGTVHTKIVLKKRFADGTEESTEQVETTQVPGQVQGQVQHQIDAACCPNTSHTWTEAWREASRKQEEENTKEMKGKGWFWSKGGRK